MEGRKRSVMEGHRRPWKVKESLEKPIECCGDQ